MEEIKSDAFFVASEAKAYDLGKGVKRQFVGYDNNIMTVKVFFDKDAVGEMHKHPHAQTCFVHSGKFEVAINGVKKILQAGDGFYVDPDVLHGCYCLEEGVLVDTFSPIREDFYRTIKNEELRVRQVIGFLNDKSPNF